MGPLDETHVVLYLTETRKIIEKGDSGNIEGSQMTASSNRNSNTDIKRIVETRGNKRNFDRQTHFLHGSQMKFRHD